MPESLNLQFFILGVETRLNLNNRILFEVFSTLSPFPALASSRIEAMAEYKIFLLALLIALLLIIQPTGGFSPAPVSVKAAPQQQISSGDVVISQFRFRGNGRDEDDFVEIFNRTCGDVDLSNWHLDNGSDSAHYLLYQFPASTTLHQGQYYLVANPPNPPDDITGYDDPQPPTPDGFYITDKSGPADVDGVALISDTNQIIDQVGTSAAALHEGTPLTALTADDDKGYRRKTVDSGTFAGAYADTNNNVADFPESVTSQPHNSDDTSGTCGIRNQTISGNAGVGGAMLSYNDGASKTVTADGTGAYTLTVPWNWSGTVTPSKTGYVFLPINYLYTNVTVDQTVQNYTATLAPTSTPTPTITNTPTITLTPTNTPTGFHPRLIVNEVAWYGTIASTSADWIELYNPLDTELTLDGWTLEAQDGRPTIDLTGILAGHGYYLLGHVTSAQATATAAPTPTCTNFQLSDHVTINQYFTDDVSSGGETLFLVNPSNIVEDYANRDGGSWPAGSTSHSASMERTGGNTPIPDSNTAWVTYADSPVNFVHDCSGNRVYGTPGGQNWAYNKTPTPTPKPTKTPTTRPPTAAPKVIINEFLPRAGFDWNQDGAVDVKDEFIELKNLGPINVDLKNWKLDDEANLGSSPFTLPSQILKPGDRAVFYGSTTHILLDDSGDTVRVINPAGVVVDARTYGVVAEPDQSHCRFPDGFYWRRPCFPTPGTENALTGFVPSAPPSAASKPPICLLADTVPDPFRQAECAAFGADMVNEKYWNDQAGLDEFPVPDNHSKWKTRVE